MRRLCGGKSLERSGSKKGIKTQRFFLANYHRRKNTISKMNFEGQWVSGDNALKQCITGAFKILDMDQGDWIANCQNLRFSELNNEKATRLEALLSKGVGIAVRDLNGDKALSPNGITAAFFDNIIGKQ